VKVPRIDVQDDMDFRLCFACGEDNPIGLRLKPVYDGQRVTAEFTPAEQHQGWLNITHGGILYTLLDEVTAYTILCHGIEFGVTARSTVRFKHVAPVGQPLEVSAWATKVARRLVETRGQICLKDGTLVAEGESLFYSWKRCGKAFLWDMDGVISDSGQFHFAAWQDTFGRRGVEFNHEDFAKLFGSRNDFIIREVMGERLAEDEVTAMVQEKEACYREKARGHIRPLPGVIKLLEAIKKGNFRLALASSAPTENIELASAELELDKYFDVIVSGTQVAESKPSPQIYLLAAEKLGAEPRHCLVIEDSPLGVTGAKAAGMKCLAVTNTHPEQVLRGADKVVDSLEEVDLITLIRWI
jgi:beta-phosphoglucomutase family hydrolase